MYTLEDDQDTSSRLRQPDMLGVPFTSPLAEGASGSDGTVAGQFLDPADRVDDYIEVARLSHWYIQACLPDPSSLFAQNHVYLT